jgi:hypothetical protein
MRVLLMTKLNEGDIIQVNGWVMLDGLDSGKQYKVKRIFDHRGRAAYGFSKPRGNKEIVAHYVGEVDASVENKYCNNNITIVKRAINPAI